MGVTKAAVGWPIRAHGECLEHSVFRIVVELRNGRVLIGQVAGKTERTLPVPLVRRIGQIQVVEKHGRLTGMHPVEVRQVVLHQHRVTPGRPLGATLAVAGELGDEHLVLPLGQVEEAIIAAEQIQQGPAMKALKGIVHATVAGEPLDVRPEDLTIRLQVVLEDDVLRLIHERQQASLQNGPLRHGGCRPVRGDLRDRCVSHLRAFARPPATPRACARGR